MIAVTVSGCGSPAARFVPNNVYLQKVRSENQSELSSADQLKQEQQP